MKLLTHIPGWLRNKYFIALACFACVMLFLDKNDIFTQMARNKEQQDLERSRDHYTKQINELNSIKKGLTEDPRTIERYSREKHLMKRDNEDLFLVPENSDKANN